MPKRRPAAEIALVIAFKAAAVALLYILFFSPSRQSIVDRDAVLLHLISPEGKSP